MASFVKLFWLHLFESFYSDVVSFFTAGLKKVCIGLLSFNGLGRLFAGSLSKQEEAG